jgi:hypothetical protein
VIRAVVAKAQLFQQAGEERIVVSLDALIAALKFAEEPFMEDWCDRPKRGPSEKLPGGAEASWRLLGHFVPSSVWQASRYGSYVNVECQLCKFLFDECLA